MLDLGPATQRADDVPSDDELIFCARALRKAKALGVDEIPCEAFRDEGPLRDALFELIRTIWRQEDIPKDMVLGLFVMIYKGKGSSDDMTKYRCICLLNHAYKLVSTILLRRLAKECEHYLPESQAGFRRFRGCQDNIWLI